MLFPAKSLSEWKPPLETRENLYQELEQRGYVLRLLHPRQTHQFHERQGLRAKTDRLDAMTIAKVLLSGEARAGYVPSERITAYRELVRLHMQLSDEAAASAKRDPCPGGGPLPRVHPGLCRSLPAYRPGGAQSFSECSGYRRSGRSLPSASCSRHRRLLRIMAAPRRKNW